MAGNRRRKQDNSGVHAFLYVLVVLVLLCGMGYLFYYSRSQAKERQEYIRVLESKEAATKKEGKATELRADQYAYRLLINLIMKQKKHEIPEELAVFWEDQYLSPIILFEMFRLFDVYSELREQKVTYQDHPTPQERKDNILSMFEEDVPEEMNTEEGNIVLELVLNSSEYAENWLRDKISRGKL